jgi:hypothetical protein
MNEVIGGVFIASNHFLDVGWVYWWWAHRTVRWHARHVLFTGRCAPRQHARWGLERIDRWSRCPVAAPDSPVPHRTCPVTSDFAALNLPRTIRVIVCFCRRPLRHCTSYSLLRWLTEHVQCTPNSSVNYSGAHPENSWEWPVRLVEGLVHRTLSGAPKAAHSHVLLQIWLCPQLNFFLCLCWTLCTWDKWHLDKLVSPRGLCWSSTTKINYRKWLGPFPF